MFRIVLSWRSDVQLHLSSDFSVPFIQTKAFFYPLMGYYLDRVLRVEELTKRQIGLLVAAAVAGILLTCGITYADGIMKGELTEDYADLFVWLTAMAVFVVTKYLVVTTKKQLGSRTAKCLEAASLLTFGIYLLDPLLQHWVFWPNVQSVSGLPVILVSVLWCLFSMVLGGGITYLLKKSPLLL